VLLTVLDKLQALEQLVGSTAASLPSRQSPASLWAVQAGRAASLTSSSSILLQEMAGLSQRPPATSSCVLTHVQETSESTIPLFKCSDLFSNL